MAAVAYNIQREKNEERKEKKIKNGEETRWQQRNAERKKMKFIIHWGKSQAISICVAFVYTN